MELLPLPCTVCIYSWPTVFWCVAIHIIFLFSLTGVSPTKWMESLNLSFDSFFFFRLFSNVTEWSSEWMHSCVHGRWPRLLISDHSELYSPSATSTSNNHRKGTIFQHGWPAYCALCEGHMAGRDTSSPSSLSIAFASALIELRREGRVTPLPLRVSFFCSQVSSALP
jgi:hypothetical protein